MEVEYVGKIIKAGTSSVIVVPVNVMEGYELKLGELYEITIKNIKK